MLNQRHSTGYDAIKLSCYRWYITYYLASLFFFFSLQLTNIRKSRPTLERVKKTLSWKNWIFKQCDPSFFEPLKITRWLKIWQPLHPPLRILFLESPLLGIMVLSLRENQVLFSIFKWVNLEKSKGIKASQPVDFTESSECNVPQVQLITR